MSADEKDDLQSADFFEKDVLEAVTDFEVTGDGLHLLEALRRLCAYRIAAPGSLYLALKEVLDRYHSGAARTLDEAFNVSRARNWNQPAELSKRTPAPISITGREIQSQWLSTPGISKIGRLYRRAEELAGSGMAIDEGLWKTLAEEFHVSPSRARDWYYEVKNSLKT